MLRISFLAIDVKKTFLFLLFLLQLLCIPIAMWKIPHQELSPGHGSPWLIYSGIVYSYIVIVFAIMCIFVRSINWYHVLIIPAISLLLFELSLLKYLVFITELVVNGELNFEDAQFRHADKQNIYVAFIMTSFCCLSYVVYRRRGNVQHRAAMGLTGVLFFSFFLYHMNILTFQGSVFLGEMKGYMNKEMSSHVYDDDFVDNCPDVVDLNCFQWIDGDPFPEEAKVKGSDWLLRLNNDYDEGWKDLIARKSQFEPSGPLIWREAFVNDNLDNTFAPQYYLHIVFMKYEGLNRLMVYSGGLNKILTMGSIAGVNLMFMMILWITGSVLVVTSHDHRSVNFNRVHLGFSFAGAMCVFTVLAVELNVFACASVVAYYCTNRFRDLKKRETWRSIAMVVAPILLFYMVIVVSGRSVFSAFLACLAVYIICHFSFCQRYKISYFYASTFFVIVGLGLYSSVFNKGLAQLLWSAALVFGILSVIFSRSPRTLFTGLFCIFMSAFSLVFLNSFFALVDDSDLTKLDKFYSGAHLTYYSMAALAFVALRPVLIFLIEKHSRVFNGET